MAEAAPAPAIEAAPAANLSEIFAQPRWEKALDSLQSSGAILASELKEVQCTNKDGKYSYTFVDDSGRKSEYLIFFGATVSGCAFGVPDVPVKKDATSGKYIQANDPAFLKYDPYAISLEKTPQASMTIASTDLNGNYSECMLRVAALIDAAIPYPCNRGGDRFDLYTNTVHLRWKMTTTSPGDSEDIKLTDDVKKSVAEFQKKQVIADNFPPKWTLMLQQSELMYPGTLSYLSGIESNIAAENFAAVAANALSAAKTSAKKPRFIAPGHFKFSEEYCTLSALNSFRTKITASQMLAIQNTASHTNAFPTIAVVHITEYKPPSQALKSVIFEALACIVDTQNPIVVNGMPVYGNVMALTTGEAERKSSIGMLARFRATGAVRFEMDKKSLTSSKKNLAIEGGKKEDDGTKKSEEPKQGGEEKKDEDPSKKSNDILLEDLVATDDDPPEKKRKGDAADLPDPKRAKKT